MKSIIFYYLRKYYINLYKYFINLRNFIIKNFGVNIIGFKKIDNNNNYLWISDYTFSYLYNIILQIIPFIIIKITSNSIGYHVIYKYDNIYQITEKHKNHILPIILQFEAFNNHNPLKLHDLTDKIKYYNSSLALHVFSKLNIPSNYDSIKIKYLSKGKMYNKDLNITECKNNLIYNLFEN